ncbi:MAG: ATP-binding protein, partial [Bacteroidota bacterium]
LECGTLIESMIFSFALAFRTKIWEAERLESSQALVDQLRKNEELQNSFNQTLQEEVKIRTLQLKDALEKAEAGSRAKSEFLSSISHELRTPLNGIIGMTNLLKEDHSDTREELFHSLESSSQDLLRLVDNVLDYTALDSENVQLHPEEFILGDLLQQLSSAFEPVGSARGIGFNFPLVGKEILLTTDRDRLSQILSNILHNSFKFTSSGSVTCSTEVQLRDQNDHDQIRFIISDTGIGMTEEEISLATTPFEQTQKGMQRGLQGVGIGLAIVKKLVGLMNGELAITSTKGEGTTVTVSLPVPMKVTESNTCDTQSGKDAESALEGKSVLLVEDHLVNQKVASKYLTKWGMKVEVAENGLIAVNKVRESSYDLILMDLHMPVMDGFTSTREIKALGLPFNEIPIIALSAATHLSEVQQEVMESGMLGFVTKPIKPVVLRERLESCFHSSPS